MATQERGKVNTHSLSSDQSGWRATALQLGADGPAVSTVGVHIHVCVHAKSLQLGLTLCEPIGGIPPGSSVHGILQERTLEWVALHSSKGSSQRGDRTC